MFFSDKFITYLKSVGYSPIRLPKTNLRPLQLLTKKGKDLDRLGDLSTVFTAGSNIPLPEIKEDIAATISGQRSSDLKIGVGLSILGSIIGAMGGSKLGLDATYQQAKTIAFEYRDVIEESVDVAKLDQFLADADTNPFSRYVTELLDSDDVYVTTSTIKSKRFTVDAKASRGVDVRLNVPEIQGVVGGSVKVSGHENSASKLTYEGNVPLVFGFQAVRLFYERSRYTAFEPLEPKVAMRDLERVRRDGTQLFMTEAPFVSVGDI